MPSQLLPLEALYKVTKIHAIIFAIFSILIFSFSFEGNAEIPLDDIRPPGLVENGLTALNPVLHPKPLVAPNIVLVDINGKDINLLDFPSKYLALHFWATWCAPCRSELPSIDVMQTLIGEEHLVVIPISLDRGGLEKVKQFYDEFNISYLPIFRDQKMKASRLMRVSGIPTTIFIDPNKHEIARVLGDRDWLNKDIIAFIKKLIKLDKMQLMKTKEEES